MRWWIMIGAVSLASCSMERQAVVMHRSERAYTAGPSIAERYRGPAERIKAAVMRENDAYRKMIVLCDDIGHRLSGSAALERAVEWAAEAMRADGQENVRLEPVMVPHWVRGNESATMIEPRYQTLTMLGLGGSIGTGPDGITAPVVAVRDEQELTQIGDGARGKIVLFNNAMPNYHPEHGAGYGTAVRFRSRGAQLAAEKGAVASLVRSVTAHSLNSPHTGAMRYGEGTRQIPHAALAVEDAEMLARFYERGIEPVVTLKMEAKTLDPALSANVIGELRGRERPDEVVVISGHIDSWDVGQGAHDDAGGCVQAVEAINALRKLDMIPRRTIRVVLWTNEENGLAGGRDYAKKHEAELPSHVAAIESDGGSFKPVGYSVQCDDASREAAAAEQMRDLLSLFEDWGATSVTVGSSGADLGPMKSAGVVLMGHRVEMAKYFDYHHSPADTLDKVDPVELSQNVAVMATVAYVLADMPDRLGDRTSR